MITRMLTLFALMICCGTTLAPPCRTQSPPDGRHRQFRDELLDNLIGDWKLTRKIRGQTVENTVRAEWVLNHQFLRLHMRGTGDAPEYEAMIFIGYDFASERYVAH